MGDMFMQQQQQAQETLPRARPMDLPSAYATPTSLAVTHQVRQPPPQFRSEAGGSAFLPELPPTSSYEEWRFGAIAAILAAAARPQIAYAWMLQIADQSISFVDLAYGDLAMAQLDSRLFSALLVAMSSKRAGPAEGDIALKARTICIPGCGRQLFRVIDAEYLRYISARRQRALKLLLSLRPATTRESLENTLGRFDALLAEVRGSPEEPMTGMLATLIRTLFGRVPSLAAIFATADLYGLLSEDGDIMKVMRAIRAQVNQARDEALMSRALEDKPGLAHAAKGKGKEGKGKTRNPDLVCPFCSKRGHDQPDCWYDPSSPAYRGPKPSPPATQGVGYAAAHVAPSDLLLLESGSTFHLASPHLADHIEQMDKPITLATVSGTAEFWETSRFQAGPLGELQALITEPGTMPTLSMRQLVREEGCDFHWTHDRPDDPVLIDAKGVQQQVQLYGGVPVLQRHTEGDDEGANPDVEIPPLLCLRRR